MQISIEVPISIRIDSDRHKLVDDIPADLGLVGLEFAINHHRMNDEWSIFGSYLAAWVMDSYLVICQLYLASLSRVLLRLERSKLVSLISHQFKPKSDIKCRRMTLVARGTRTELLTPKTHIVLLTCGVLIRCTVHVFPDF